LKATVETDLESTRHDIPIPLNAKVLSYVELFQGRLHDFIEDGLKRGSQYLPMIQNVFRAEGLPLDLAYVPLIESAFKPNALSRAKAKGVWQFMRPTAIEHGLKHDWYIDERSDPEKATQAAARYLLSLQKFFNGDWHLALASYNGGPGRVQRAMKRAGLTDLWSLVQKRPNYLPRETREYVPMILAAIVIARNPVQYGFNIDPEPSLAFERVTLSQPVDLRRIAEWTGASVDEIQQLNPELRRWTTPVRYPDYALKVPKGTAEVIQARLNDAPATDIAALQWHTVKKGETLLAIARKLKVSRGDLAEANYLKTTSRVNAGQKLIVPRAPATLFAARPERPAPGPVVAANAASETDPPAVSAPNRAPDAAPASQPSKLIYQVKRGDTLFSIAQHHRTTVDALRAWNHLSGDNIAAGSRLTILRTSQGLRD
jgi:membrane-bound lytic murein transglycosylase D